MDIKVRKSGGIYIPKKDCQRLGLLPGMEIRSNIYDGQIILSAMYTCLECGKPLAPDRMSARTCAGCKLTPGKIKQIY